MTTMCFFDQLPAEIFYTIFNYLWAHEILHSFLNINNYLNNILSNHKHYLVNFESIRKSHFDLICRFINPSQVISLILSDKLDTPKQSRLFRSLFSLKQFTHLRVLKFIELHDDGESFFSDLSKLEHLISLEIDVRIDLPFIKSIPTSLKRLIIKTPKRNYFNLSPSISMIRFEQLHHLTVSNCSCTQFQHIFRQAVRLTSLNMFLAFPDPKELDIFIDFHQIQSKVPPLTSLSLSIDGCGKSKNATKPK